MKNNWITKILGIVAIGLLLTGKAFADCKDDIKVKWWLEGDYVGIEYLNYDDKHITIVEVAIFSIEKKIIKSYKTQIQIDPFGENISLITIRGINKDAIKFFEFDCVYKIN